MMLRQLAEEIDRVLILALICPIQTYHYLTQIGHPGQFFHDIW
jgi:hypothetical protein